MVFDLSESYDIQNSTTKMIYLFGIRFTYYTNTGLYSVKEISDKDIEISNRFILRLMINNLKILCRKKNKEQDCLQIRQKK